MISPIGLTDMESMASSELGRNHALPSSLPNKSCERCRALKVRCVSNPKFHGECERCSKAEAHCVFMPPTKRRPRTRTRSRVARLEQEITKMRSLLEVNGAKYNSRDTESTPNSIAHDHEQGTQPFAGVEGIAIETNGNDNDTNAVWSRGSLADMDVIDCGVLSLSTAQNLTSFFAKELTAFFPLVLLTSDMDANFLRQRKPILFLSILAASAVTSGLDIAEALRGRLLSKHARVFFVGGLKSLELIQAVLLAAVFEYPPASREHLKLSQFTHVACTMALELGLHVRFSEKDDESLLDDKTAQARALLISYHLAASIATKSGGINMLPHNNHLKKCTSLLAGSVNVHDRQLAYWFQLQSVVDDTLMSFSPDNIRYKSPAERPPLQPILRYFNSRMQSWKENLVEESATSWMMLEYYNTHLVVYEAANGEAFRDPDAISRRFYTLPPLEGDNQRPRSNPPLNAAWVDISAKWVDAAQAFLDAFLLSDIVQVRKFPEVSFSRVFAAMTSLLKLYDAALRTALGTVIEPEMIKAGNYAESVIEKLSVAGGNGRYKIPSRWYSISLKTRQWLQHIREEDRKRQNALPTFNSNHTGTEIGPMRGTNGNSCDLPVVEPWLSVYRDQDPALQNHPINMPIYTDTSTQIPFPTLSDTEEHLMRLFGYSHGQW